MSDRFQAHPRSRQCVIVFLIAALLSAGQVIANISFGNEPIAVDDAATTDDRTAIAIDLLANDSDPDGDRLEIELGAVICPGGATPTVVDYGDGSIGFTPEVDGVGTCTVSYQLKDGRSNPQTATATVTVTPSGGGGPDIDHGEPWVAPTTTHMECGNGQPNSGAPEKCCWQEIVRAVDWKYRQGQSGPHPGWAQSISKIDVWANTPVSDVYNETGSENHGPICAAAKYLWTEELGGATAAAHRNLLVELLDAQSLPRSSGGADWMGSEIFSPLYQGWLASVWMVVLNHSETLLAQGGYADHAELRDKARDWLRTYWSFNALGASPLPTVRAETVTESQTWIHDEDLGWSGLSLGLAGSRAGSGGCVIPRELGFPGAGGNGIACGDPGTKKARALFGRSQVGHMMTAMAFDWRSRSLELDFLMQDYFYAPLFVAAVFSGGDVFALDDGRIFMDEIESDPAIFGLTALERQKLHDFVDGSGRDLGLLSDIVGMISGLGRSARCSLTFRRSEEGTSIWFGDDDTPQARCNVNGYPQYGVTLAEDGSEATYLSPERFLDSRRVGNQICLENDLCIPILGGDLIYELRWPVGGPLRIQQSHNVNGIEIATHPQGRSVTAGGTVSFTVDASAPQGGPLSFEWLRNGETVVAGPGVSITSDPNAGTSTLTLTGVEAADQASYRCRVGAGGEWARLSKGAWLEVGGDIQPTCDLEILGSPANQSVEVGQGVTLSALVGGADAATTYRWMKNGSPVFDQAPRLVGASSTSLSIDPVQLGDAGSYFLRVEQSDLPGCSVSSPSAALAVQEGAGSDVVDTFGLNGTDRVIGAPLNDTFSEIGARQWDAHGPVSFAAGGTITISPGTAASHYSAGLTFDPAHFPTLPVLELRAEVKPGRSGEWAAIGFGSGPLNGLWGQGLLWMYLAPDGTYQVRTRGHADAPLASGTAGDFDSSAFNQIRLEIHLVQGTVSAWVNSEQVLYRSYIPDFASGWLQPTHAALQFRLTDVADADAPAFDSFEAEARLVASTSRATFTGQPAEIPGSIEGWHYDLGGEGVGYHDVDAINDGNVERDGAGLEGVDLWRFSGSSQVTVRSFEAGEWLETTAVGPAGDYELTLEVASESGGTVGLALGDGALLGGPWTVPATGGNLVQLTIPDAVSLPALSAAGPALRLRSISGQFDLQRYHLEPFAPPIAPDDDVVVLPYDTTATALSFSVSQLLAGDQPAGEVQVVDIPGPQVRLEGDMVTYFPQQSFWSRRWDTFTYVAAHVDDPTNTATAQVLLLAGGVLAAEDYALSLCSEGAPTITLAAPSLLANDKPSAPEMVRITGIAQAPDPDVATVSWDAQSQAFTFDPQGAFCTGGPHSFGYRVELIEDPSQSAVGTVQVFGTNPVVAVDDFFDFTYTDDVVDFQMLHSVVLENDAPQPIVEVFNMDTTSANGGAVSFNVGRHFLELDPNFWARGWDEVKYRATIDGGVQVDEGTIRINALPQAEDDVYLLPFFPLSEELSIRNGVVLGNDGPHLNPPVIGLFGVADGQHGAAIVRQGSIVYSPGDDFWRHGLDQLEYSIWYKPEGVADPDVAATGQLTLISQNALRAVDDAFRIHLDAEGYFHFFEDQLVTNDLPAGLVAVEGWESTTLVGGSLEQVDCEFGVPCGRFRYTPPAGGLPEGWDRAEVHVRLETGPADTRTGHVYLYEGPVPNLLAIDDLIMHGAGEDFDIPFQSVLANDIGQNPSVELVQTPLHAQVTTDVDGWTYRPSGGFHGMDFFRYVAVEPATGRRSAPATVEVVVDRYVDAVDDTLLVDPAVGSQVIDIADLLANDRGGPGAIWLNTVSRVAHGALLDFGAELIYQPDEAAFAAAGEDSFTYTSVLDSGPPPEDRASVRLEAFTGCAGDFEDDFESGALTGWTVQANGGSAVTVDAAAALEGSYGLDVNIGGFSNQARATSPSGEARAHAGWIFLLDASDLVLPEGSAFTIAQGRGVGFGNGFQVEVRRQEGALEIRVQAVRDGGAKVPSAWSPLSSEIHSIFVDWWASSAPQLDDGGVRLFIDGWLAGQVDGVDNDQRRVTQIRLGAVLDVGLGTGGSLRFDAVSSCAGAREPVMLVDDDFEDGDLSDWNRIVDIGGGSIAVDSDAAITGLLGVDVAVDASTQTLYLEDARGGGAAHYWSHFRFDPDSFTLPVGSSFRMLAGLAPGDTAFALSLGKGAKGYQLHVRARQDDGSWSFGPWVDIADAAMEMRIEWRSATNSLSDGELGHLRLWVDDVLVTELDGLATSAKRIDLLRLGAITGLPSGAAGNLYFDDFLAWTTP